MNAKPNTDDLLKRKEIFETTLQSIGDAIICTDTKGNISFMNRIAEKLTGYMLEEVFEQPISDCFNIVNAFTREAAENPIEKVLTTGSVVGLANHTVLISRNGTEYHIADSGAPIISDDKQIIGVVLVFRDVSKQYLAEEKLKQSEGRFRSLFENMKEGVAIHDLVFDTKGAPSNYRIIKANPAYQVHTGISLPAGYNKLANEIYQTPDPPYLNEFSQVALTGKSCFFETYFAPLKKYFQISVVAIKPNSFATIFEDITPTRVMINELTESEERFRKIFEESAEATLILSNNKFMECNKAALKLLKFKSKKSLLGKSPALISPVYQEDGLLSEDKATEMMNIAFTKGSHKFGWTHLCADGSTVECEIILTSIIYKGSTMLHTVIRDDSERKHAMRRLSMSEEKYRTLYETMAQGVIYCDNSGEIISANLSAKRIFEEDNLEGRSITSGSLGWTTSHLNGQPFKMEDYPVLKAFKTGRRVKNITMGISGGNLSRQKWLNINVIPNKDKITKNVKSVYVTLEDITDLIVYEKALLLEKQRAEESDKLKTAFLANMSHEIRTPMNAIMGFSQLMLNSGMHESSRQYYSEIINNSCVSLLRIIDDILDISKIESGQLTIVNSTVDINNMFDNIVSVFAEMISEKRGNAVRLIYKKPSQTVLVKTDETRLLQVLNNLIENAVKFTETGYIKIGFHINESMLEFFVEDTGIGIDKKLHDKIFERFWQAEIARTGPPRGTGLGLSICRKLVELMGGKIGVKSIKGKGSKFTFTIPFLQAVEVCVEQNKAGKINKQRRKLRLLVVEDDLINSQYLKEILKRYDNCESEFAFDGTEAINMALKNHFDVILLDIQLPGTNGYEVARIIRKHNTEVIIIAQTAFAMPEDKQKCISSGCNSYISKPINFRDLFDMLDGYAYI